MNDNGWRLTTAERLATMEERIAELKDANTKEHQEMRGLVSHLDDVVTQFISGADEKYASKQTEKDLNSLKLWVARILVIIAGAFVLGFVYAIADHLNIPLRI